MSADEFLEVLRRDQPQPDEEWDLTTAKHMLAALSKKADINGDGRVSFGELAKAMTE